MWHIRWAGVGRPRVARMTVLYVPDDCLILGDDCLTYATFAGQISADPALHLPRAGCVVMTVSCVVMTVLYVAMTVLHVVMTV